MVDYEQNLERSDSLERYLSFCLVDKNMESRKPLEDFIRKRKKEWKQYERENR